MEFEVELVIFHVSYFTVAYKKILVLRLFECQKRKKLDFVRLQRAWGLSGVGFVFSRLT